MGKVCVLAACAVALLCAPLLAQEMIEPTPMDLDTALAFFVDDQIMIGFDAQGHADLLGIIAAFKAALNVPEDLDDTDKGDGEDNVGALEIDPSMKHVVTKLSQAYYTLANVFTETLEEGYPLYRAGKHYGFKSLRMNPEFNDLTGGRFDESVARETDYRAMYWTNSNWLRASKENKLEAVVAGVPKRVEMLMNRILELAPEFIYGGVYRSLGGYYEQLPGGLIGMRDIHKAQFYLCHVVDEPGHCSECSEGEVGEMVANAYEYLENQTFFVEYYLIPEEHWEDASRILQDVLAGEIGEAATMMNAYAKAHAQDLYDEFVKEHVEP
jgi:hypothetical protein